ncbi:MAG TPA: adenylate kinase [archaeon]|nr:adenylate kinase [archaeon]
MKLVVAAVPGAGKTTVLNYVKKKFPRAKIVSKGDLIFEYAKKHYGIKNRDELRKKLKMSQQRTAQNYAAKKIGNMRDRIVIVDTHFSIKTPIGYIPGVSTRMARHMKLDGIILLEFRPKDVLQRRKKDKRRHREKESEEDVDAQQHVNQEFAMAIANDFEIPVDIVNLRYKEKRPFEHARKAADEVVKIIKRLMK